MSSLKLVSTPPLMGLVLREQRRAASSLKLVSTPPPADGLGPQVAEVGSFLTQAGKYPPPLMGWVLR